MKLIKKTMSAGALAVAALFAAPASAAFVGDIPGGSAVNDYLIAKIGPNKPVEGWFNANLYLSGGPANITVQYYGAEAGFRNSFTMGTCNFTHNGGGSSILAGGAQVGSCAPFSIGSGLLDFYFSGLGGKPNLVNGFNTGNVALAVPNFFVTFGDVFDTTVDGITAGSGNVAWLFLDDGGAGGDDNHDDLVMRLSLDKGNFYVPEPGSLALLGLGLAGLAAVSRRKQKQA